MAVGGALGLPFAACCRGIRLAGVVLGRSGGVGGLLGGIYMHPQPNPHGGSLDLIGALALALVLLTLLLPVSKGLDWGWTSPVTL